MWEEHLRRLGGCHCLAPDLPGHGRSNRLPWRSRIDPAEQVAEFIQRRSPSRRAHLVGLSLAAWWRTRCRLDARSCWIGW
jgi:pimeloyl-ACP methyl ester carboxylesterase